MRKSSTRTLSPSFTRSATIPPTRQLDAIATFFAAANARLALILARVQGEAPRFFLTK
jgi:hypothetical protein